MSLPEPAPDLYQVLGISRDASPEEIKRAYRSASKRAHPDTGGSVEAFAKVQHAWNILGDAERRARYDATGDSSEQQPDNRVARIHSLIMGAIDRALDQRDVVDGALRFLEADHMNGIQANEQLGAAKKKLEKVRKRLKFKGAGVDLIDRTLAERIGEIDSNIARNESVMADVTEAIEKLENGWDYEAEAPPVDAWQAAQDSILRDVMFRPRFRVDPGI